MRKNKKVKKTPGIKTISIHHGDSFSEDTGSIMPPIFSTSTFTHGNKSNFDYTRSGNPNFTILENVLRAIEDANHCTVFGSGIAAVTAITSCMQSGDIILCESNLYGCTIRMFEKVFKKFGIKIFYCDFTKKEYIKCISEINPTLIWLESPTNPLLKVLNLEEICDLASSKNIPVVVDNTFCTAIIQNPLKLGATLSLISTTKFINGHSDALGGAVLTNSEEWNRKMIFAQKSLGLNPSPFDCWLITRGLKTLPLRIDQQTKNAEIISQAISSHKLIEELIYPFNPLHPQFKLAKKQMNKGGSMISLKLKLDKYETFNFCKKLNYFKLAESLGGVESLICHPATMSHASVDEDTKNKLGINDSFVRLSIGCEDSEDLLSDILLALENFQS
tara:strand:+ start:574 stop:1743 length:1170 start_codon:yes stop_codon:yes gene_type:complete